MKGKLPGSHIINETSKRVGLHPQKETTPENLVFHRFKQKTQIMWDFLTFFINIYQQDINGYKLKQIINRITKNGIEINFLKLSMNILI